MVSKIKNISRCLLVQPLFSKFSSLNYTEICNLVGAKYPVPPLGLMTVAALLPQHWEFKLIDTNVKPLLDEYFEWADIICTGGMLSQQIGILSIIDKAHQYGKKVVVGGPEPSSQPQLYQSADYLVIGEGEKTISVLLRDLRNGCESGEYYAADWVDMRKAVIPRFDLIQFADYLFMGIQFSRGCPYQCEFCNVIELFGRKPRTKTPEQILNELQSLYELGYRGHIFFVDDNFFGDRKRTEALLQAMAHWLKERKYPFYFGAEATINLVNDDKLLQMAKDVDFRYISIGIETPEDHLLKRAQKHQNVNKSIPPIIKKVNSYGMAVDASFILGFDGEDEHTADHMIQCIQDSGICMAMVGTLYALPNTQLARRLKNEGRLFEEGTLLKNSRTDIDQMTSGLNFITERPRKDILEDFIKIIKTIYDPVHYYQRLIRLGLQLKRDNKYKPASTETFKLLKAFIKVCVKTGLNKKTGKLYWKTFFVILIHNPIALELVLNMAAMYIHLSRQFQFISDHIHTRLQSIDHDGEEKVSHSLLYRIKDHVSSNEY